MRDEGEMAKIATVSVDDFSSEGPRNLVLDKLIALRGAPPRGTDRQRNEFFHSETASALIQFVYDNV